jgi:calcineurin-like phosphoesterase family protein
MLIQFFNKQVPEDGLTYFLGDMTFNVEATKKVIERLNGTKVLILGNHDKGGNSAYLNGFDVVMNGAALYIENERVTLSHCPLFGIKREDLSHLPEHKRLVFENWHGESRENSHKFSFKDEGQFHLHGHIHSTPETKHKTKILDKQYDVGLPANNYRPVPIGVIESWIRKYKDNL